MKLYFTQWSPVEGEEKVKLCLCTREFEVGDEVTTILAERSTGKVAGFIGDSKTIFWFEGFEPIRRNFHSIVNYGKVIGPITEEAMSYVKRGDEYEKEEVDFVPTGRHAKETRIMIKGPCGHFH